LIVRRSLPILVLLLASTACGQVERGGSNSTQAGGTANASADAMVDPGDIPAELPSARRADRETGPDLDPETAPGVAFDYRYSFRLEADRVAEIQQEHQQLCARYGPRCRITDVDYRAANADDVEAMLSFLVDPAIASQFGREGVRAVTAADGEVTESEINGAEIGTELKANVGNLEELQAELERVEARLAAPRLRWRERARLDDQRQSLRQQIAELRSTAGAQERQLATTPILFRYGSGALAPGPAREQTIGEATEHAADSFLAGLKMLFIIFVSISPWLLTVLLIWVGFHAARRRWPGQGGTAAPLAPEAELGA
jgi:hypothetical protein